MRKPAVARCRVKPQQQLLQDPTVISVTNEQGSQFARLDRLIGSLCRRQWRRLANHFSSPCRASFTPVHFTNL